MSNLKLLAGDTAIYGFGTVLKKMIGFLLLPFYTRALNPAEYGILETVTTFAFFLTVILGLGMTGATGRYFFIAKGEQEKGSVLYTSVIIRVFSTLIPILLLVFFADFISRTLFDTNEYSWVIVFTLLLIPIQSISELQELLFRYYRKPWKYLLVSSIRAIIKPSLGILLVIIIPWGVFGATLASLISSTVILLFAYFYYTRKKYVRNFSKVWARKMLKYGIPLIFTGILIWVNNVSDRVFLLRYSELDEIGFYSIANVFSQPILIINMALNMSSVVLVMSLFSDETTTGKPRTKAFMKKIWYLYMSISIVLALFISIFSFEIVFYITRPVYISSILAIPFLLFANVVHQSYQLTSGGMSLFEKTKPYMWISFAAALTNILLNFYFIPKFGFLGAAITTILSNLICFVLGYFWSQKYFYIKWDFKRPGGLFIVALCTSIFFPFAQLKFEVDISIWIKIFTFLVLLVLPFFLGLINIGMVKKLMVFRVKK